MYAIVILSCVIHVYNAYCHSLIRALAFHTYNQNGKHMKLGPMSAICILPSKHVHFYTPTYFYCFFSKRLNKAHMISVQGSEIKHVDEANTYVIALNKTHRHTWACSLIFRVFFSSIS